MTRHTKIVATLGPASSDPHTLERMLHAGVDVVRMNFSHGRAEDHVARAMAIREASARTHRPVGILADLQGPKIRVGRFSDGRVTLTKGAPFILDARCEMGDIHRVGLDYKDLPKDVRAGDVLLLDDGRLKLDVEHVAGAEIHTRVRVGGELSNNKGINRQGGGLSAPALTAKDMEDIRTAAEIGVDFLAVSFPKSAADMYMARQLMRAVGGQSLLIAKIERCEAVANLEEILDASDGIMVARGDLAVEVGDAAVPALQKKMIRAARERNKLTITATQMMESMISSPVPTRAEVSDVATAVFEGADAVMLSAESAAGQFPVEAVATMDRIARQVERDPNYRGIIHAQRQEPEPTGADAIAAAARQIAETLNLAAVVCYTTSGATGLRAARERPSVPVIVISPVLSTARRLSLAWGLHCVVSDDARDENDMVDRACQISFQQELAKPGQRIITTAGVPFGTPGSTNMLRIAFVGSDGRGGL